VRVCPSQKQDSAVDTISLSGGERSYSTVSFIMAIWNAVDVPFYFLDEFDVFMVSAAKTMGLSGIGLLSAVSYGTPYKHSVNSAMHNC
jgi:hypothetical protein